MTNVYEEAWERGSSWQEAIRQGIAMLPKAGMRRCAIALENCHDPSTGFRTHTPLTAPSLASLAGADDPPENRGAVVKGTR